MKKNCSLVLAFVILLARATSAQTPAFMTDSLNGFIERGLKDWNIPGLAVVVVKDGKIVHLKGYGVKDIQRKEAVDEHTLFLIASNTKLFTATALSLLDYRKKISLDDRMTRYFPAFRVYDSTTTSLVTIRDMLSHRIGTKTFQGDFTFWNTKLSRDQVMKKMQLLKPTGQFRQDYGYCNSCFLAAGQVIPKATGQPWEVFIYDSIIVPLKMTNTHMLSRGMANRPNIAVPYTTSYSGTLKQVPYDQWDNLAPAASMVSDITDLSHWLMFQLDSGRYEQREVMPFAVLQKTRDLNIITNSRKSAALPTHFRGYGLGLFATDYNGRQVYWHTGGAGGMLSNVCFVPEEKLGIAILSNNDNQVFFEALRYQILDAYLGVKYIDRSQQQLAGVRKEMEGQLGQIAAWKTRVKGGKAPLAAGAYPGSYNNPIYGNLVIAQEKDGLSVSFSNHENLTATLRYMDHDEWLMEYSNIEYGVFAVKFTTAGQAVRSLLVKVNEYVESDPYLFERTGP